LRITDRRTCVDQAFRGGAPGRTPFEPTPPAQMADLAVEIEQVIDP
jgi:hypothetical protein